MKRKVEIVPGLKDPWQAPPLDPLPIDWACQPEVRANFIKAFADISLHTKWTLKNAEGDGIIIVGGGRYWLMAAVAARWCRQVSTLPIQIWHRGEDEPVFPDQLADVDGVSYHDATQFPARIHGGWNTKSIAWINCGFERFLYLDADAYPLADPRPLFDEVLSDSVFAFWSDWSGNDTDVGWNWFFDHPNIVHPPSVQGGQFFFDRVKGWRLLVVAHWLNQHSDYTYYCPSGPGNEPKRHGYGDQDQWRVALASTKAQYKCLGEALWVAPALRLFAPGRSPLRNGPIILHRPQAKWFGNGSDKKVTSLPGEETSWKFRDKHIFIGGNAQEVFESIYDRKLWGHLRSNGALSTVEEIKPYVELVNALIQVGGWTTAVDLGCGDGGVALALRIPHLVGVDVSRRHVQALSVMAPERKWMVLDVLKQRDQLPAADVALLRDVVQHWPSACIHEWFTWIRSARKYRWIIICTSSVNAREGDDCCLGGYRPLKRECAPLAQVEGLLELQTDGARTTYILKV
jgi:hypothetical protein